MSLVCDGCEGVFDLPALTFMVDYGGHECRYCVSCEEVYRSWQYVTTIEEARRQREFDLWQVEMRAHVVLKRMPMDFGPVKRQTGSPVVLG